MTTETNPIPTWAITTTAHDDLGHDYPTLGWLRDGRQVVQATEEQIESDPRIRAAALVQECSEDDLDALACEGESETNYVREVTETNPTLPTAPYPRDVARAVAALRPDLAAGDAIAAVLTAEPQLTADEVIEILDDATEEWSDELAQDDSEEVQP